MFAGHLGAALAVGRAERRINIGVLVFAALFIDFALWLFVLLGWESVMIPADYARTHQPVFDFPYTHSLLAVLVWSAAAGAAVFLWYPRLKEQKLRAAAFVGLAVFSHWLLDALVHVAGLPLAGAGSSKVGLGLWRNMPVDLPGRFMHPPSIFNPLSPVPALLWRTGRKSRPIPHLLPPSHTLHRS